MSRELTLDQIHEVLLGNLKFFHRFCTQNNIKYFLAYGTLLGCIRHNGFIPWDDDVDVWMFRDDYERLRELFKSKGYQIENYKLCTKTSTDGYYYGIARISDQNYKYISLNDINYPDMGTFIDIYPLDYVRNEASFHRAYSRINYINRLFSIYTGSFSSSPMKNSIKRKMNSISRIIHKADYPAKVEAGINRIVTNEAKKSDRVNVAVPVWFTTGQCIFPYAWFKENELHDFETEQFFVPSYYHKILSKIYGDYMELPPLEKRIAYHKYKIIRRHQS